MESESIQNLSALRVGTYRACNSLFLIAVLQFHEARTRVLDYFRKVSARCARKFGLDLERLRKSDEKFIKAFRASPLPISITTRMEGRFIDVNDAFLQMLGFSREQVIGHTVTEIEFWDDPDARTRMLMELAEGKSVKTMPVKFRSRSGEYREGNLSAELIDLDGVPCVLAITQDLTETKRLEKQLRQVQKMEAMGQLVGGIAHDFNNMLSIVMGYSDLALQNQSAADPNRLNLVQIKKAAERAASFIRQLLTFSRESAFFPRVFELNRVISGLDEMLSRMLGEDITLTFRPIGFPVYINADLGQIEQLVMNLVLNARDAMPNGGEIFVETGIMDVKLAYVDKHAAIPPGRYVTLSVTDTGCGMDDKTLTQMFEPFFTTKPSGTGLGLATVREIVRRSNGRVWVHSKPGEGTTFRLYFPQVDQPANFLLQQQHEFFPSGGRETVLVVEDDETLRLMMATLLRDAGYSVLDAKTAQEATELFGTCAAEIDLLLTDGVMSQMSGIALAKRLRALRSDLKVVVVSGYGPGLMAKYGPLGPRTDFVEKPFTRNTLLGSVRALLDDKPTLGVETPSGGR